MRVLPVACLKDNYAYLVVSDAGRAAIVDASEAGPVREALKAEGVAPRAIWSTHHHWDHVGGNESLAAEFGLEVVAHASDRGRVPAQTRGVDMGNVVRVDEIEAWCVHVPGHTLGAVSYFVETEHERVLFTGDTLFCGGCGRLFEGTAAQMYASLTLLSELPPDTRVYCGHEYTEDNLRFAASLEPSNEDVARARGRVRELRARGAATVGTTIEEERRVNPFLRVRSPQIRKSLRLAADADDVAAFAAVRAAKDGFR